MQSERIIFFIDKIKIIVQLIQMLYKKCWNIMGMRFNRSNQCFFFDAFLNRCNFNSCIFKPLVSLFYIFTSQAKPHILSLGGKLSSCSITSIVVWFNLKKAFLFPSLRECHRNYHLNYLGKWPTENTSFVVSFQYFFYLTNTLISDTDNPCPKIYLSRTLYQLNIYKLVNSDSKQILSYCLT